MDRPFMDATIEDLERLLRENTSNRTVLAQLREELQLRTRKRAQQLLREVTGLLGGRVPMPPGPLKEDGPDKQLPLIE